MNNVRSSRGDGDGMESLKMQLRLASFRNARLSLTLDVKSGTDIVPGPRPRPRPRRRVDT
jgi:hypothetical protein